MAKKSIYTVSGAVQAGGGLYIPRKADEELLNLCRDAAFAYVLTSRQMGKSSLMFRTAEQLDTKEKIQSVIVDLQLLGKSQSTAETWYLDILTTISSGLRLKMSVSDWWRSHAQMGVNQRFVQFFREILLVEVNAPIVVFVDEIDMTLGLPFTDDFYTTIRYFYNARALVPEFHRLSFVLIGTATPGDLISDPKRTPFNIGQRIDLTDFTNEEALPLADGFGLPSDKARQTLNWVLEWTGGHPYLTQKLCLTIAERNQFNVTKADIDEAVARTFFGRMSEQDSNLQFVRDMLTKRAPDRLAVLSAYRESLLNPRQVSDEEQSPIKSHLKLSGVVRRERGKLVVRNSIYKEVFNKKWIKEHWPATWWETVPKYLKIAASVVAILIVFSIFLLTKSLITERRFAESERLRVQEREDALTEAKRLVTEAQTAREKAVEESKKAEAEKGEKEKLRYKDIARTLAAQAPNQMRLGNDLAALLARQAYLFNDSAQGNFQNLVYDALHQTLFNLPYFNTTFGRHSGEITTVVFSPDGGSGAWGCADGAVYVRKLREPGATLKILSSDGKKVLSLVFMRNGRTLAVCQADGKVRLWNWQQDENANTLYRFKPPVLSTAAFNSNGTLLACGSDEGTVRLYDLQNRKAADSVLINCKGKVTALTFGYNYNGQILISGTETGAIQGWEIRQTNAIQKFIEQHKGGIGSLTISRDYNLLASGGLNGTVWLWSFTSTSLQNIVKFTHNNNPVYAVAFNLTGNKIFSGSADGKIRVYNRQKTDIPPQELICHESSVQSLCFSPKGILVSGSSDKTVRWWYLSEPDYDPLILSQRDNDANNSVIRAVAFHPKNENIASGGDDKKIRLWQWQQSNVELKVLDNGHIARAVAFSPDGNFLASASSDKTVRLWNLKNLAAKPRIGKGHTDEVRSTAFSADGKILASGSADKTVRLWDLEAANQNGKKDLPKKSTLDYEDEVNCVAFSPKNTILAAAGKGGVVFLWDWNKSNLPIEKLEHNSDVNAIAIAPDGSKLVSGYDDGTLRLWDIPPVVKKSKIHTILLDHGSKVYTVAFSPKTSLVAVGLADGSIKIWNLLQLDADPIILRGHENWVYSISFNTDGTHLVSASADKTIRVWNTSIDQLAAMVCKKVWRNLTEAEWKQFVGEDIPYNSRETCPELP